MLVAAVDIDLHEVWTQTPHLSEILSGREYFIQCSTDLSSEKHSKEKRFDASWG